MKLFVTAALYMALVCTGLALASTPAWSTVPLDIQVLNEPLPEVLVEAKGANKQVYNTSAQVNANWRVQVRGQCPDNYKIKSSELVAPNGQIIPLVEGGNVRSLTPNNGSQWEEHTVSGTIPFNNQALAQACTQYAQQAASSGQSTLEEVLNSNFTTQAYPGLDANLAVACVKDKGVFDNVAWKHHKVNLPVSALCAATGYAHEPPFVVNSALVEITETEDQSTQVCRLKAAVGVYGNKPNEQAKYRFEHGRWSPQINGYKYDMGPLRSVNTGASGAAFENVMIDVPVVDGPEQGKLRIKVQAPNPVDSPWVEYTMDCESLNNSIKAQLPPKLTLSHKVQQTKMVGGDLCPSVLELTGTIEAQSPQSGQLVFVGDSYMSGLYAYDLQQSQTKVVKAYRELDWSQNSGLPGMIGGTGNMAAQGMGSTGKPPRKQTIKLGFNATNAQNSVIASVAQQNHQIVCSSPKVNPGLAGGASAQAQAPTATMQAPNAPAAASAQVQVGTVEVRNMKVTPMPTLGRGACLHRISYDLFNQSGTPIRARVQLLSGRKVLGKVQQGDVPANGVLKMAARVKLPEGRQRITAVPQVKGWSAAQMKRGVVNIQAKCGGGVGW